MMKDKDAATVCVQHWFQVTSGRGDQSLLQVVWKSTTQFLGNKVQSTYQSFSNIIESEISYTESSKTNLLGSK